MEQEIWEGMERLVIGLTFSKVVLDSAWGAVMSFWPLGLSREHIGCVLLTPQTGFGFLNENHCVKEITLNENKL